MANERAIVITGASTGIGKACALRLAEAGFYVFAGVRTETDRDSLRRESKKRLTPLILDVCNEDQIRQAVKTVEAAKEYPLFGLLNNAGHGAPGPMELVPIAETREIFEVNVLGNVAVTKAFLPLLRKTRGRIVNMGSFAGRFAPPGMSGYAASKAALEAISDSLRVELWSFGITVSIMEPATVDTPIFEKGAKVQKQRLMGIAPEVQTLYAPLSEFLLNKASNPGGISPDHVAKVVVHAFTARRMKPRYLIGGEAKFISIIGQLPTKIRDFFVHRTVYGPTVN